MLSTVRSAHTGLKTIGKHDREVCQKCGLCVSPPRTVAVQCAFNFVASQILTKPVQTLPVKCDLWLNVRTDNKAAAQLAIVWWHRPIVFPSPQAHSKWTQAQATEHSKFSFLLTVCNNFQCWPRIFIFRNKSIVSLHSSNFVSNGAAGLLDQIECNSNEFGPVAIYGTISFRFRFKAEQECRIDIGSWCRFRIYAWIQTLPSSRNGMAWMCKAGSGWLLYR